MADICVLAPAFYPDAAPVWRLVESARRFDIPLTLYGLGEPNQGWIYSHITRLREELEARTEKLFMFTDAIDCFFLRDLNAIVRWWEKRKRGTPLVVAASETTGLNAGGFIGNRIIMIDLLRRLELGLYGDLGDPQVRWRAAYGHGALGIDEDSEIFQTTSGEVRLSTVNSGEVPGIFNVDTGYRPCLLHCNGGYTDPVTFKSDRMDYWWRFAGMDKQVMRWESVNG
jgi:hypothetical protein